MPRISAIPAGTTPTGIEIILGNQGGQTVTLTAAQIAQSEAAPTFGTSVTTPRIIGGTGAASSLTLQSTSGVGTTDLISFKTGAAASQRWRINSSGALIGSPATGTTTRGISTTQTPAGTTTGNVVLNQLTIDPDTVVTDANFVIGLNVAMKTGAGIKGGREAIQAYMELAAASDAANANRNYVGLQAIGTATASDGGTNTGAGALGAIFGGSWYGYAQNTATNLLHVTGGEINFALQTGSSAKHKTGILVCNHTSDAVQGATTDAGYVLSSQGGFGVNHGFLISDTAGFLPIKSTGTVFGTTSGGAAAHGIDLSGYTFSSDAFKSTGFLVDGPGNVTGVSVLTTPTTVGALPAAAGGNKGGRMFVTDSNAASFTAGIGAVVAAGGTTNVPVVSDGTNWRIG